VHLRFPLREAAAHSDDRDTNSGHDVNRIRSRPLPLKPDTWARQAHDQFWPGNPARHVVHRAADLTTCPSPVPAGGALIPVATMLQKGALQKDTGVHTLRTPRGFSAEVIRRAGTNLNLCFHCLACAGACPFPERLDLPPGGVIRMVQLALEEEVLKSSAIWGCVICHTCSGGCPNAIDVA